MRYLVVGDGRSGKDTVASIIAEYLGETERDETTATSWVIFEEMIKEYPDLSYQDRLSNRIQWRDWGVALKEKHGQCFLLERCFLRSAVVTGTRTLTELASAREKWGDDLVVIYVDRDVPLDPTNEITIADCDYVIKNRSTLSDLHNTIASWFMKWIESKQEADIHRTTIEQVLGIHPNEVDPELRNIGKIINFSFLYGSKNKPAS